VHIIKGQKGQFLDDIREGSHNEALGDFIAGFIREKSQDSNTRLHCSLAGGRKTMSFYLGSALQLFGRPWDKLYHVLVSPEFESHPEFYYKPRKDRSYLKEIAMGKWPNSYTRRCTDLLTNSFHQVARKIPFNGKGFQGTRCRRSTGRLTSFHPAFGQIESLRKGDLYQQCGRGSGPNPDGDLCQPVAEENFILSFSSKTLLP
jgi:hypothetical protein